MRTYLIYMLITALTVMIDNSRYNLLSAVPLLEIRPY